MAIFKSSKKTTGKAAASPEVKEFAEQSAAGGKPDDAADLREMIAVAAYYRAQGRQFEPGHELEDWLAAENEIRNRGATIH